MAVVPVIRATARADERDLCAQQKIIKVASPSTVFYKDIRRELFNTFFNGRTGIGPSSALHFLPLQTTFLSAQNQLVMRKKRILTLLADDD